MLQCIKLLIITKSIITGFSIDFNKNIFIETIDKIYSVSKLNKFFNL